MASKTGKTLAFLGLAGLGYLVFSKINLSRRVQFKLKSVEPGGDILNPILRIVITAINPTQTSATVQNISGQLFYNFGNTYVGDAFTNQAVKIKPNSATDIPLNISISDIGLLQTILGVINAGGANFQFTGSALVDNFQFPLNFDYNI
jgi:hypothetical protein